jgi:hypothetical protein
VTEKRQHERFLIWFPVTLTTNSGRAWAVCRDASSGGMCVSCTSELAVGCDVTVAFKLDPSEMSERRIEGRVVRLEPNGDDPQGVWPHRISVAFHDPAPELHSLLRRKSEPPNN